MKFSDIQNKLKKEGKIDWNSLNIQVKSYVPINQKFGLENEILSENNKIIEVKNSFYTINRLNYEVCLYLCLLGLYTDIDLENNDFTNEMCDVLIQSRFKDWLFKKSEKDSAEFEQVFKNIVYDRIRILNATKPMFDIDGIQKLVEEFNKIPEENKNLYLKMSQENSILQLAENGLKKS